MHHIDDIYFCCICLRFFKIHLNVVSKERSWSNSMSNMKNSGKRQIALLSFVILQKFAEMGRIIMHQRKLQCIGFNYQIKFDYVVFPWWYSRWRLETHCQNIRK